MPAVLLKRRTGCGDQSVCHLIETATMGGPRVASQHKGCDGDRQAELLFRRAAMDRAGESPEGVHAGLLSCVTVSRRQNRQRGWAAHGGGGKRDEAAEDGCARDGGEVVKMQRRETRAAGESAKMGSRVATVKAAESGSEQGTHLQPRRKLGWGLSEGHGHDLQPRPGSPCSPSPTGFDQDEGAT